MICGDDGDDDALATKGLTGPIRRAAQLTLALTTQWLPLPLPFASAINCQINDDKNPTAYVITNQFAPKGCENHFKIFLLELRGHNKPNAPSGRDSVRRV